MAGRCQNELLREHGGQPLIASFPSVLRPLRRSAAVIGRGVGTLLIALGALLVLGVYTQIAGYLVAPFATS